MKTGIRGCCGKTKRRGKERYCAQLWITVYQGKQWCYYHDPRSPKKFGEPYGGYGRASLSGKESGGTVQ